MNTLSLWLIAAALAAPLSAAPPSAAAGGVAGQFESYTFALSWEPTFCEAKPNIKECASQSPERFDASHLALHGLWPDKDGDASHSYGYCGVGPDEQALDRAATWCRLPEPSYSDATRAALTTVMPGVASCLDHHEWSKHGTCTGMTDDDYFALAAALVQQVAGGSFGRYLAAHAGRTVDESEVIAAFEQDFGAGSGDKLILNCADVSGAQALLEARLRLPNPLRPASELSSMLLARRGRGNCPSSFLLDPVPSSKR